MWFDLGQPTGLYIHGVSGCTSCDHKTTEEPKPAEKPKRNIKVWSCSECRDLLDIQKYAVLDHCRAVDRMLAAIDVSRRDFLFWESVACLAKIEFDEARQALRIHREVHFTNQDSLSKSEREPRGIP